MHTYKHINTHTGKRNDKWFRPQQTEGRCKELHPTMRKMCAVHPRAQDKVCEHARCRIMSQGTRKAAGIFYDFSINSSRTGRALFPFWIFLPGPGMSVSASCFFLLLRNQAVKLTNAFSIKQRVRNGVGVKNDRAKCPISSHITGHCVSLAGLSCLRAFFWEFDGISRWKILALKLWIWAILTI